MFAPVSISPPIFGSPTFPAPTTRHCLPASFTNMGNRLVRISSHLTPHCGAGTRACRVETRLDTCRPPRQTTGQASARVPTRQARVPAPHHHALVAGHQVHDRLKVVGLREKV